jgi:SAM-dependent methyltransferase
MKISDLDETYWNERWEQDDTGWDVGYAAPAICNYVDKHILDKEASILIPGCGNAYEAAYLASAGYTNITIIDIAPILIKNLQQKFKKYPNVNVIHGDFFLHKGQYDFIIEQTFFCALPVDMRSHYVLQCATLLKENGIIFGLLFNKDFVTEGPPFGGHEAEYQSLFQPYFSMQQMAITQDSILPRKGTELFFVMKKLNN